MPSDSVKAYRQCGYCHTWNTRPCGEQCAWSPADPPFVEGQALPDGALFAVTHLNTVVMKLAKGEATTEDYAQARERLIAVVRGAPSPVEMEIGSGNPDASAELVVDRAGALAPSTSSESASVSQSLEEKPLAVIQAMNAIQHRFMYGLDGDEVAHKPPTLRDDTALIESLMDAVSAPLKARIEELEAKVDGAALLPGDPSAPVQTEPLPNVDATETTSGLYELRIPGMLGHVIVDEKVKAMFEALQLVKSRYAK